MERWFTSRYCLFASLLVKYSSIKTSLVFYRFYMISQLFGKHYYKSTSHCGTYFPYFYLSCSDVYVRVIVYCIHFVLCENVSQNFYLVFFPPSISLIAPCPKLDCFCFPFIYCSSRWFAVLLKGFGYCGD